MKKQTGSETVTETDLSRLTGKSREWVRRRVGHVPRDEKGRMQRAEAERILLPHCGSITERPNPFRWVAERAPLCFIENLFREENKDLLQGLFRGRTDEEMEEDSARLFAFLNLFLEGFIDADMFSRTIAAESEGEDIDGLCRRVFGPNAVKFKLGRVTVEMEDIVFPEWLGEAAARIAERHESDQRAA